MDTTATEEPAATATDEPTGTDEQRLMLAKFFANKVLDISADTTDDRDIALVDGMINWAGCLVLAKVIAGKIVEIPPGVPLTGSDIAAVDMLLAQFERDDDDDDEEPMGLLAGLKRFASHVLRIPESTPDAEIHDDVEGALDEIHGRDWTGHGAIVTPEGLIKCLVAYTRYGDVIDMLRAEPGEQAALAAGFRYAFQLPEDERQALLADDRTLRFWSKAGSLLVHSPLWHDDEEDEDEEDGEDDADEGEDRPVVDAYLASEVAKERAAVIGDNGGIDIDNVILTIFGTPHIPPRSMEALNEGFRIAGLLSPDYLKEFDGDDATEWYRPDGVLLVRSRRWV